ncbi:MAG: hypothetical protein ACJA01_003836 [Saprospiraceae bacterium]|jgi:hypothetical protein
MKNNITIAVSLVVFCLLLASCGGKSVDRPDPILTPEQVQQQATQQATPVIPPGGVLAPGVKHYTCPNNCAGSGGDAQGTCPGCGTAYAHNQAFHDQAITQGTQPAAQPNAAPEPPQNTAGIWHYTCSNGCAEGAGNAIACASCGNTLVHNTTYHN